MSKTREKRKRWNERYRDRLRKNGLGPHSRDVDGATITFRNEETGERRTEQFVGYRTEALERACARCAELGPDWRIACYSTPSTILADLKGARSRMSGIGEEVTTYTELPERVMLSRVGRLDLLHSSLTGSSMDEREIRRRDDG
jgi:hypothetical protein